MSIDTHYGNIIYPVGEHHLASFVGVFPTQCHMSSILFGGIMVPNIE